MSKMEKVTSKRKKVINKRKKTINKREKIKQREHLYFGCTVFCRIDELENELKQHLDKVAELKQLLYKRKKDVFEDKPKVRIEALEPESIKEDLTRPIEECSPTTGSDSLTDRPVVTDFNTTVDTCVMVDYNQKLYEGWLGVEESKRTSHSRVGSIFFS